MTNAIGQAADSQGQGEILRVPRCQLDARGIDIVNRVRKPQRRTQVPGEDEIVSEGESAAGFTKDLPPPANQRLAGPIQGHVLRFAAHNEEILHDIV